MNVFLWIIIGLSVTIIICALIGSAQTKGLKRTSTTHESDKDRRFRLAREKWTPKEIIEDSDRRWQIVYDEAKGCLVYTDEWDFRDFVLRLSDINHVSFSRNFELVFSTCPVYKDKLDDINNIIPEWLHGSRYLKEGIKNLNISISYSSEEENSCHIIDLFDVDEVDRKSGIRDIEDFDAPYLIDAFQKGLGIYGIILQELIGREKGRWLNEPMLHEGENPLERIKANIEFFQN